MNDKQTPPTNAEILERHITFQTWANGYGGRLPDAGQSGNTAHEHRGILLERAGDLETEVLSLRSAENNGECGVTNPIGRAHNCAGFALKKRIRELEDEAKRSHRVNKKIISELKNRPTRSYHGLIENKLKIAEEYLCSLVVTHPHLVPNEKLSDGNYRLTIYDTEEQTNG